MHHLQTASNSYTIEMRNLIIDLRLDQILTVRLTSREGVGVAYLGDDFTALDGGQDRTGT